jgi:hypothetical protein
VIGSELDESARDEPVASGLVRSAFSVAGGSLIVETDEPAVLDEVALLVGSEVGASEAPSAPVILRAGVWSRIGAHDRGLITLHCDDPGIDGPQDILLGLSAAEPVFTLVPSAEAGVIQVALRGESEPLFLIEGPRCLFRRGPGWPSAVALFVFNRFLRARPDALFFHAASVAVAGRGVLIVGPREAGKSTTVIALAARGHALLGDDMACYLPATDRLVPFARALGIRPGPRARAASAALQRLGRDPDREGTQRVPVQQMALGGAPEPVPLRAVLFLEGFAAHPEVSRVSASRDHIARLQPMAGSLVNASPAERVFQMARLLSRVAVFQVRLGDPDETARQIEEALSA